MMQKQQEKTHENDPEMAIAKALTIRVSPQEISDINRYSRTPPGYTQYIAHVIAYEKVFADLIGKPYGWKEPIFQFPHLFKDTGDHFKSLAPAERGKEGEIVAEMIQEGMKRAPPLNDQMGLFQDESYRENKTKEE